MIIPAIYPAHVKKLNKKNKQHVPLFLKIPTNAKITKNTKLAKNIIKVIKTNTQTINAFDPRLNQGLIRENQTAFVINAANASAPTRNIKTIIKYRRHFGTFGSLMTAGFTSHIKLHIVN